MDDVVVAVALGQFLFRTLPPPFQILRLDQVAGASTLPAGWPPECHIIHSKGTTGHVIFAAGLRNNVIRSGSSG